MNRFLQEANFCRLFSGLRGLGLCLALVQVGCGASGANGARAQAGGAPAPAPTPTAADVSSAILGSWQSNGCEAPGPTLSQRRTYAFSGTDVDIHYDVYGGTACEAGPKMLIVHTRGVAKFVEPSAKVPGATDVLFTFESRALTPTAAGVGLLKQACGQYAWAEGVEIDVSKDGCGKLVQSNTECPIEYDLAEIAGDQAFFGDRSHPLCSIDTRPRMLLKWGVVKQP
jgi:hypothetical protein